MDNNDILNPTFKDFLQMELERTKPMGDFTSPYEVYAHIKGELDEFWEETKKNHSDTDYGNMLVRLVKLSSICWRAAESLSLAPPAMLTQSDEDDRINEVEALMEHLLNYCEENGEFGEPAQRDGPKPVIVQFESGQIRSYRERLEQ